MQKVEGSTVELSDNTEEIYSTQKQIETDLQIHNAHTSKT